VTRAAGPTPSVWQLRRLAARLDEMERFARFTVETQRAVLEGRVDLPRDLLGLLSWAVEEVPE
jgi:hypothetical protein